MTEFSNLVRVTLACDSTKSFQFMADEFTFEPTQTEDQGGVYWDCEKTFVVDMPDSEAMNQLKVPRKAIVFLKKLTRMYSPSDSNIISIGSASVPARVYLAPHLSKAKLVVRCKMLNNPFG